MAASQTGSKLGDLELRFSLQSLLVIVTLIAFALGWILHPLKEQQAKNRAIQRLNNDGFTIVREPITEVSGFSAKAWFGMFSEQYLLEPCSIAAAKVPSTANWEDLARFPHVSQLSIEPEAGLRIPRSCWATIAQYPKLQSLTLANVDLDPGQLAEIGHLQALERISLTDMSLSDRDLATIASFPKLTFLTLVRCQATETGLAALAAHKRLTYLDLSHSTVTDAALAHLGSIDGLTQLNLSKTPVTDAGLALLNGLTQLQTLNLSGSAVTDEGVIAVQIRFPKVLVSSSEIERSSFESLVKQRHYSLSGPFFTDASLRRLDYIDRLTDLRLDDTNISPAGLRQLARFKTLRSLQLSGPTISAESLRSLGDLPGLEELSLRDGVDDESLTAFAALRQLAWLSLSSQRLTDEGLLHLANLTTLTRLSLDVPQMSSTGFEVFAQLPALEDLTLSRVRLDSTGAQQLARCGRLRSLALHSVEIDEEAICALQDAASLASITLHGNMNERCLPRFAEIKSLRSIQFWNDVSEETTKKLRALNPQLKITMRGRDGRLKTVD